MKNITLLILFVFSFSCGKVFQKNDEADRKERRRPEINDNVDIFLRSQEAKCERSDDCNPSIGKLVVWNQNSVTDCTGVLISSKLFMTTANCLPRNMRVAGMGCVGRASISFPQVGIYAKENAYCSQVIFSDTIDSNVDPAIMKTSFAILKLDRMLARPVAKIARTGLDDSRSYHVWTSSYDSSTLSTIEKKKCRPVYNSYANPFAIKETSPGLIMSGCSLTRGNNGGVIVNNKQNIVGIVNSSLYPSLTIFLKDSGLYTDNLKHLTYASNAFCLKYGSEIVSEECEKAINVYKLDRERSKILHSRLNHLNVMNALEKKLEKSDKYFSWDIIFTADKNSGSFDMQLTRPKCFFKTKNWINEFRKGKKIQKAGSIEHEIPRVKINTILDENLVAKSQVIEEGIKTYRFSFSPYNAYYFKNSYVRVQELGILTPTSTRYEDVTDECGE